MESLFSDQGNYQQTCPPPFVCWPDSPGYSLLFRAPGRKVKKRRKRGSTSGVQAKCRLTSRLWLSSPDHLHARWLWWISLLCCSDAPSLLSTGNSTTSLWEPVLCWDCDWWDTLISSFPVFTATPHQLFSQSS